MPGARDDGWARLLEPGEIEQRQREQQKTAHATSKQAKPGKGKAYALQRLSELIDPACNAVEEVLRDAPRNATAQLGAARLVFDFVIGKPSGIESEDEQETPTRVVLLDPKKAAEVLQKRMAEKGKP